METVTSSQVASWSVGYWPDLPVGIKSGIGVSFGDVVYVGLGSSGSDLYSLDVKNPGRGWEKKAMFNGPDTHGAAAAVSDGKIFVFSGNGKVSPDARSPIIFDSVYVYGIAADRWDKVDTRTPVGLSGARALPLRDGRIAIIGGYNKELFDRYLADIAELDRERHPGEFANLVNRYMSMHPDDYRWNGRVLCYEPRRQIWSDLGENPFLPNCDSAAVAVGENDFLVIGGEIKPGLRTPMVKSITFSDTDCRWQRLADLPKPAADDLQEGVAGAFAGCCGEQILVAGGVNFKGAQANAAAGKWYAHEGLTKKWRDEIYAFDGKEWLEIGKLPHGLGYGISVSLPDGMLIVGGEDSDGRARNEVFAVRSLDVSIAIES